MAMARAEGNLTKKGKGALQETWTYGYDQRNQLIWVEKRATDGGTLQLKDEFRYDAFGSRIEKKIDSDGNGTWDTTQRYALDGWKNVNQALVGTENWDVWADLNGSNSLTTRYIRGDVIDQLFARQDAGTPYWYLTDHLGSIRDVIDSSAVVKDSITYDGFGNITAETDSNYRGRYAWTGREIDQEIQLQYNRARYYDAATGRWMSQDPLGFDAGDSNLYRYVQNRSLGMLDPSGLQWFTRTIASVEIKGEPAWAANLDPKVINILQPLLGRAKADLEYHFYCEEGKITKVSNVKLYNAQIKGVAWQNIDKAVNVGITAIQWHIDVDPANTFSEVQVDGESVKYTIRIVWKASYPVGVSIGKVGVSIDGPSQLVGDKVYIDEANPKQAHKKAD